MVSGEILVKLRNVLAMLYSDQSSIRRLVADADMHAAHIDLMGSSVNVWHSVLLEAQKAEKLDALLAVVEDDYGTNSALQQVITRYRELTGDNTQLESTIEVVHNGHSTSSDSSYSDDAYAKLAALDIPFAIGTLKQVHKNLSTADIIGLSVLDNTMLRDFGRISQAVDTALHQRTAAGQRIALNSIDDRLDKLVRELWTHREKYHDRFYPIAQQWKMIVADHLRQLNTIASTDGEIDNPYIINLPLTLEQEIFVGRVEVAAQIERLLLNHRHPPLLVYGQRRMGKTSLLKNLSRLLPESIIPLYVDLQGPATKSDSYSGFLYNIARGIVDSAYEYRQLSLPTLTREALQSDPFTVFDEWLDEVEKWFGLKDTALLMLDEFETLDKAIMRGRYDEEDVLGMLRHMIQHRPRFRILLAGSHTLEEYQRWSSYLINVEAVHLSYLTRHEAIQLIERPVPEFSLQYEPTARDRILELTRCHPFLIQLLCSELVALKNTQAVANRRIAQVNDVEAAIPEALQTGSFYAGDIRRNQIDDCGRTILTYLAKQGEGGSASLATLQSVCSDDLEGALHQLLQRELIEVADDGYRFQVELIRRWFAQ